MLWSHLRMGAEDEMKVAVITGATGLLGSAVSMALARAGWKVALLCHSKHAAAQELLDRIQNIGAEGIIVTGDLCQPKKEVPRIVAEVRERLGTPYCLIHSASAPLQPGNFLICPADLDQLMAIQVTAFLAFVAAMLPEMLRTQTGTFVAILSSALQTPAIPGWHAYTAAKAAMAQVVNELAATYGAVGIRSLSVIPGAIRSLPGRPGVIRDMAGGRVASVDADDVAKTVVRAIEDWQLPSGAVFCINGHERRQGRRMSWAIEEASVAAQHVDSDHSTSSSVAADAHQAAMYRRIGRIMQDLFGVDTIQDVSGASIGTIPGWDSLAHITLIMEIESAFQVQFRSEETSALTSVSEIVRALCRRIDADQREVAI